MRSEPEPLSESLQILVADDPRPEPVVKAASEGDTTQRGVSVSAIVEAAHETSIDEALSAFAIPGLDRDSLDKVLTYCAERQCEQANATCAGCQRRTEIDGFKTLDDFISAHGEIVFTDSDVKLSGHGQTSLKVGNLQELAKRWQGEQYWYWARRVLRKLRHGVRRAHIKGTPVAEDGQTPAVILVGPQLADNIGMAARAMGNFGLDTLRLVAPRDGWPNEKARISASGANYIIDDTKAYETVPEAISDLNWVCATTARQRDLRKPVMTPLQVAAEMSRRIEAGQRCGILFGRENSGLSGDELADADALVMIPVNPQFASLNLAQAVLLLGYQWVLERPLEDQSLGRVTTYERPIETGLKLGKHAPASKEELFGFFTQLENALDEQGFFRPPERRGVLLRNLRAMFTRMEATDQEVRTLRGIVATLLRGRRVT